jgi:hypothetical protein
MVALHYAVFGVEGFQKHVDGRIAHGARWLLAPYRLGAWINSRLWTMREASGRDQDREAHLARTHAHGGAGACAWHRADRRCQRRAVHAEGNSRALRADARSDRADRPRSWRQRAEAIDRTAARRQATVLVCCALGYSRSAAAVAAWLLRTGRAEHADEAVDRVHPPTPTAAGAARGASLHALSQPWRCCA